MSVAAEKTEKCFRQLPAVFGVLLDPCRTIVDDTCVEKLLGWLQKLVSDSDSRRRLLDQSAGVKTFLQKIANTECEPETLSFGLKLMGLLCQHPDALEDLARLASPGDTGTQTMGDLAEATFTKAKEGEYWEEAGVRCAWFHGINAMVTDEHTHRLLSKIGAVHSAILCLDDRSMFVTSAAQDFVVSFIVESCKSDGRAGRKVGGGKEGHGEGGGLTHSSLCDGRTYRNLVKHLKEALLAPRGKAAGLIISVLQLIRKTCEADHGAACMVARETDLASCCQGLIDLEEDRVDNHVVEVFAALLQKKSNGDQTESWLTTDVLIQMVLTLAAKGRHNSALKLATCLYPHHLGSQLFEVMILPLETLLGENKTGDTSGAIVDELKAGLSSPSSCVSISCQSVNTLREILSQGATMEESKIERIIHCVGYLLNLCSTLNPTVIPTALARNLIGSSKLTRAALDLVTALSSQRAATNIWDILVKIIDNPQSECMVVCKALTVAFSLLRCRVKSHPTSDCSAAVQSGGKKPRLMTSVDEILSGNFADVLHKKMYDSRWEVRDSVLNFLDEVIAEYSGITYITDWLIENQLYKVAWEKLTDSESYVRASALHALCQISLCDVLWKEFLLKSTLTQESVISAVTDVLLHDEEGFPRRAAAKTILTWFTKHADIRTFMLSQQSRIAGGVARSSASDDDSSGDPSMDLDQTGVDDGHGSVFTAMRQHASRDWDFEVKLLAVSFWEAVIDHFLSETGAGEDGAVVSSESPLSGKTWSGLRQIYSSGSLTCLHGALDDCDRLVAVKACAVMLKLKDKVRECHFSEAPDEENELKEMKEALRALVLEEDLMAILAEKTKSIDMYEENPLSLLEDILCSVSTNDENLLDCY